jgi:hypothetical protein
MAQISLMLMVDDDGTGQMIVEGKTFSVRSSWVQKGGLGGVDGYQPRWLITVTAERSLDAEAQRQRIDGLERELARERERLSEIRTALDPEREGSDND